MVRSVVVCAVAVVVLVGLVFVLRPDTRAAGPRERTFEVSVEDGEMVPGRIRVGEGDLVTLVVRTDSELDVHVHGYGVGREVGPGGDGGISFRARLTGRFAVEDHRSGGELGELVVEPR